jgi:hypothetical protein
MQCIRNLAIFSGSPFQYSNCSEHIIKLRNFIVAIFQLQKIFGIPRNQTMMTLLSWRLYSGMWLCLFWYKFTDFSEEFSAPVSTVLEYTEQDSSKQQARCFLFVRSACVTYKFQFGIPCTVKFYETATYTRRYLSLCSTKCWEVPE